MGEEKLKRRIKRNMRKGEKMKMPLPEYSGYKKKFDMIFNL